MYSYQLFCTSFSYFIHYYLLVVNLTTLDTNLSSIKHETTVPPKEVKFFSTNLKKSKLQKITLNSHFYLESKGNVEVDYKRAPKCPEMLLTHKCNSE